MIDIKKIALRAINSSRRTSPSTYIALRLLLDNGYRPTKGFFFQQYLN
ncbi:hypothetical protein [Aliarcobacter cryaerophilus]